MASRKKTPVRRGRSLGATIGDVIDQIAEEVRSGRGTLASSAASVVGSQVGAQASAVSGQFLEWGRAFTENAMRNWGLRSMVPRECAQPGCRHQALANCAACEGMFCLGHALVSYNAEAICDICARTIVDIQHGRSVRGTTRASKTEDAMAELRMDASATWADVQKEYKRLVVFYNADAPQPESMRRRNEERLKKIHAAFATLRDHFERVA